MRIAWNLLPIYEKLNNFYFISSIKLAAHLPVIFSLTSRITIEYMIMKERKIKLKNKTRKNKDVIKLITETNLLN